MTKMILVLSLLLSFHCSFSFACGKKGVQIDTSVDEPIPAGDSTSIIVDCDGKPHVGFAYCRVREGDPTGKVITFLVPPADCSRTECAFIEVWNKGTLVWSTSVKKGLTSVDVTWQQLTGKAEFLLGDRGAWAVNQRVFFNDANGREVESRAQGDIVLRVFKKTYTPLHNSQADPNFTWSFTDGKYQYKMTSSLRSYVGI